MSSSRKLEMIKDIIHNHKLDLMRLDKEATIIRSCVACTQGIIDKSYYNCPQVECNYFLHKVCGEFPLEINHGFHQSHPLTLSIITEDRLCNACMEGSKGYFYTCLECDFDLDFICATSAERQLEHSGHPHPLTLQQREIETYCNCCGKEHRGVFYQCHKCVIFWIHQDCASFGQVINAPNHPHPLHFVYSGQKYDTIRCEICYVIVDNHRSWYLQCVPCGFFSHVYCAMYEKEKGTKYEEVEEIYSKIPCLPFEECDGEFGVVGFLNRSVNDDEENQENITHFSHPEHELILQAEVPKLEDPYTGHQIPLATKCNGCTRKISSPFYTCSDCDFFLHKCCALLPRSIPPQHPFHLLHHLSNLVQSCKPWSVNEVFVCKCCKEVCNGFYYECEEESCSYKVDVECAFLPTYIVHKAHPYHLLTLTNYSYIERLPGCCGLHNTWSGYECHKCEYRIHLDCAMYPAKASHRYDHEYPFKLWYDRGAVEANYFYCERCEEYMGPKEWYYHSKTSIGDQLMHPKCILQQEYPEFPKFKSTTNFLQVDIHPHRLHLSPLCDSSFFKLCGYCKIVLKESGYGEELVEDLLLSYNCWEGDCGFRLHHSCAKKLRGRNTIDDEKY